MAVSEQTFRRRHSFKKFCFLKVNKIETLVNRETTSKLIIRSPGLVLSDFSIWMKWNEFFTCCAVFPVCWLRSPDRCLAS